MRKEGECRVVKNDVAYIAWINDRGEAGSRRELPMDLEDLEWPLLVAHRDEGSIGMAGFKFTEAFEGMRHGHRILHFLSSLGNARFQGG